MRTADRTGRGARGVTINLRTDHTKRALIDRAAERIGKNRPEFVLEAACRQATEVLLDQRLFMLDERAYKRFTDTLDAPPAENKRLKRLMMSKAPGSDVVEEISAPEHLTSAHDVSSFDCVAPDLNDSQVAAMQEPLAGAWIDAAPGTLPLRV
jgi:uncharacterized protein (DUF1778 family)